MDLEQDYILYGLQVALAFISISAAYMVKPSTPVTYLLLAPATILLGFTVYTSRHQFRKHSLLPLLILPFAALGGVVAAFAITVPVLNILLSFFSSGEGFRNYYGATSLPLLLTGLLLGAAIYGAAATSPETAEKIRGNAASITGSQAEYIVNQSNMMQAQKDKQSKAINKTANSTFVLTKTSVLNEISKNSTIGPQEYRDLQEAFRNAEARVKDNVMSRSTEAIEKQSVDVSKRVADLTENTLKGKAFLMIIPAVALIVYGLHPVIGLITAFWASLFYLVGRGDKQQSDSKELSDDFSM
ncbi:MAG: hypothetical protein ABEJ93_03790 [Candidatus Nanohalobium sp.]